MATGKVKWFNESKGWGFITTDDARDVFVHYSAIDGKGYKSIAQGQRVEFEIVETPKGPQAVKVVKI